VGDVAKSYYASVYLIIFIHTKNIMQLGADFGHAYNDNPDFNRVYIGIFGTLMVRVGFILANSHFVLS
jgi:hypothetical protein